MPVGKNINIEDKLIQKTTSKTVRQKASIPVEQHTIKKATYYIKKPNLIKELKLLSVERERDLSDLVTEAIGDLIKKYKG